MAGLRLGPEEDKLIKQIAERLPLVLDNSVEIHKVKGSEILEWGTVTEVDGEPIDPNKTYDWRYPVQIQTNHYRRIKRAWVKNGMDGVMKYLQEIDSLVGKQNANATN